MSSGQMPGGFGPILNRYKKGARKARREALGLPDPEPTPPKKLPKHRIRQLENNSAGQGHVWHRETLLYREPSLIN